MADVPKKRPQTPQNRLQAWLDAYALELLLREADPAACTPSPHVGQHQPAEAGQIRLLPPARVSVPETERPTYVLLVPGDFHEQLKILPFSRLYIPATPQEWLTGRREPALQVLCFWNARETKTSTLITSWLVGVAHPRELQNVRTALQACPASNEYAADPRFGPPLIHPLDPRHAYLQEERTLLADLLEAMVPEQEKGKTLTYPIPETNTQYLRAAEPPEYPDSGSSNTP